MIIHQDVNARRSDYPTDGTLLVSGVWATIQGEGIWAGCPATFLRTSGCNLGRKDSCLFCDTSFELHAARRVAPEDLVAQVEAVTPDYGGTPLLVVTGGEPFLQNLQPFFTALQRTRRSWRVQFESNGFFQREMLGFETWFHRECSDNLVFMVSPKHNLGGVYNAPADVRLRNAWHHKFVVEAVGPYHALPDWINRLPISRTWISPLTVYSREPAVVDGRREIANAWDTTMVDHTATAANYRYAAQLCVDYGYRMSIQMHTFAGLE